MKIIKRFISLLLALTLIVTMLAGCSSLNLKNVDNILNKGEWVEYLGRSFGLESEEKSGPYFSDISKDNELFSIVQACVEWDILKKSDTFNSKDKITREFAFATLVRAIGTEITGIDYSASDTDFAMYAFKNGIAESKSWVYMHEGVREEEAKQFVESATALAFAKKYDEHNNTTYNNTLKHETDETKYKVDQVDNIVTIQGENTDYKIGDTIAFGEGVDTVYVKVTGVEKKGGKTILNTEMPDVGDVFEKIDFAGTSYITDPSQVQCEDGAELIAFDGVEMVGVAQKPQIKELGKVDENTSAVLTNPVKKSKSKGSKSLTIKLGYGTKGPLFEVEPKHSEGLSSIIGIHGTNSDAGEIKKWTTEKELPAKTKKSTKWDKVSDKYKKGWSITGTLTINDFTVSTDVETKEIMGATVGMKSMDVTTSSKTSLEGTFTGYLTEELKVATVIIPILGPLGVKVGIKIYGEINGEFSVKYEVENNTDITYRKGKGTKKVSSTKDSFTKQFQVTVKVGVEFSLAVSLGTFAVFSIALDISMKASAKVGKTWLNYSKEGLFLKGGDEVYLEDKQDALLVCVELKVVAPIVTFKLSLFPDIKWLTLTLINWKIADEKNAAIKSSVFKAHWEVEGNGLAYKGEECTIDSLTEYKYETPDEAKEDENYDESTTIGDEHHFLFWLDTYSVEVSKGEEAEINILGMPHGYAVGDVKYSTADKNIAVVSKVTPDTEDVQRGKITITGKEVGTTVVKLKVGKEPAVSIVVMVTD